MRRILLTFILAGAVGCKTDRASKASSQMDEGTGATAPTSASPASPSSTPAPVTSSAPDARPLIVCFGDSLTAGFGADEGASYPDYLQKDLDRAGFRYRVVNEGISGNTTKDGLDRLPGIIALHPKIVVLEFGGNDGLRGLKVESTRANLGAMLAQLKRAGIKVVLAGITLPPDYGPDYIRSFNTNYTALAHQYQVPLLPFLLKDVYGVPGMMQADNTHATDKGNEVVARNITSFVTPFLTH